jgi:hypothetical protein
MIRFGAPQRNESVTKRTEVNASVQLKFVVCTAYGQTLAPKEATQFVYLCI